MDLHVWTQGAQGPHEVWIDVAHTHPAGRKVRKKAASQSRSAAQAVEERKAKRYGEGTGGVFVHPFVVEAFGGLGDGACTVLAIFLISAARKRGSAQGAPAAVMRRWRAGLGAAMYRAQASIFHQAHKEPVLDRNSADDDGGQSTDGDASAA